MNVRLACVITGVRLKSTKNGSMMAYVTVEDESAAIELVVFPRSLQQCGAYLTEDSAVLLTGKIDAREDEAPKILLNEAQPLTEAAVASMQSREHPQQSVYTDAQAARMAPQKLYLRISSMQSDEWPQIKDILVTQPGDTRFICTRPIPRRKPLRPGGTGASRMYRFWKNYASYWAKRML